MTYSASDRRISVHAARAFGATKSGELAASKGLLHDLTTASTPSVILGRDFLQKDLRELSMGAQIDEDPYRIPQSVFRAEWRWM